MEKYYTADEVAEIFKVSSWTVRDWIRNKRLTALKVDSRQYRISQKDIEAFEKKGRA